MVSKVTKVTNEMGFHMRPANVFVTAMTKYQSNMNIMAACIKCGTELTVECDGTDEQAMLDEAVSLIESGFGE